MEVASGDFPRRAREALGQPVLQRSLDGMRRAMPAIRAEALRGLPDAASLRRRATAVREDALARLPELLERFEARVLALGGHVHWARDATEACGIVVAICRERGARSIAKSKSMVTEEIGLNAALVAAGLDVTETDLGEYIIQLRRETPSHILAPALHLGLPEVGATFEAHHRRARDHALADPAEMLAEVREELRDVFRRADVGITGANALVAETGTVVLVTNEGNADLTASLPDTHVVVTGIEKAVATLADAGTLLRVLARSAIGEPLSSYTTLFTGPRRAADASGPAQFHVVLVDNGRSAVRAGPHAPVLRCIRCAACLNHCPVFTAVGGHAYGSVYSGPMGAVLTPALTGLPRTWHLPNASTLCGRCAEVCPVGIPLPSLLRLAREEARAAGRGSPAERRAVTVWGWLARRPLLYGAALRVAARAGRWLGGARGRLARLPGLAGDYARVRDLPVPAGETFQARWRRRTGERAA